MSADFYMALTEHISAEIFVRYGSRNSSLEEMLAVQQHVAACETCRASLARVLNAEQVFAAVHNNFAFDDLASEPEHLPYEQLEFFVNGKLDEVEREIAESHLAVCRECIEDLADLRTYQEIAASSAADAAIIRTHEKTFWQKIFPFNAIGSFAPVAAALLIVLSFGGWFLLRSSNDETAQANTNQNAAVQSPSVSTVNPAIDSTNQTDQNALPPQEIPVANSEIPQNTETLYALNDGQISVDQKGKIKGLENLSPAAQKSIQESLQTGKVPISNWANSFAGSRGGVLMSDGNADAGVPFGLQTPVGKVIKENQPLLRWKPLKDATAYSVAIVDEKFRVVAESGKLAETSWKSAKQLARGVNYSWQVTAITKDGGEVVSPSSPAPQARFRVVEQNLFDEISRLEKPGTRSPLALGVLYAKAGLKPEARAEFEKLARANPKSELAKRLLQSVK